jgi:RsiW-degrading membrane proteinase PrsW (M82 family)
VGHLHSGPPRAGSTRLRPILTGTTGVPPDRTPPPVGPGTAPPPSVAPPGWYPDPWNPEGLRWWDGAAWQYHTADVPLPVRSPGRRPWRRFLGSWIAIGLSAPVIGIIVLVGLVSHPLVLPLAVVPAVLLGVTLWWMDRLEPEPTDARVLSVTWGATVAPLVAIVAGLAVAVSLGDLASAVVGAPVSEEAAKGAVLLVLLRRRLIDSPIDGAVYAVAAAAGFAIVEDVIYFISAASEGGTEELLVVFLLRGLLTPFAHPLFSIWMGIAAGWVVVRRPGRGAAWGVGAAAWGLAVVLHAVWNGTLVASEQLPALLVLVGLFFLVLFVATIVVVALLRRNQAQAFAQQIPEIAAITGLSADETAMFANTRAYLRQRRQLNTRGRRLLGRLRWALHAVGSLRRVTPRNPTEAADDAAELAHLRSTISTLRNELRPS